MNCGWHTSKPHFFASCAQAYVSSPTSCWYLDERFAMAFLILSCLSTRSSWCVSSSSPQPSPRQQGGGRETEATGEGRGNKQWVHGVANGRTNLITKLPKWSREKATANRSGRIFFCVSYGRAANELGRASKRFGSGFNADADATRLT